MATEGKLEVKAPKVALNAKKRLSEDMILEISPDNVKKISDHGQKDGSFEISSIDVTQF